MVNSSTPNQASNKQPIRLGIWGLSNSGKTVYMTMLYHYLTQGGSRWRIVTDDANTETFVNDNLNLMIHSGEFCPATNPTENIKVYSYKLVNDEIEKTVEIRFFDLPGAFYMGLLDKEIEVEGETLRLIQSLNQCHGILFLISPLEEDFPDHQKGSYFTFLGNLFRSMQRNRDGKTERKLEPYIVFCITKIDHPEVYKKALGRKAEDLLLKLLGPTIKLEWIANFFHAQIDSKTKTFSPDPSKLNRCRVVPISCFGVDNHGNSPVSEEEIVIKIDHEEETVSQSLDPAIEMNKSNRYSKYEPSMSSKDINQDQSNKPVKRYKINVKEGFYPMSMLSPIEWIIKGIEKYYPEVSPFKSED